MDLLLPKIAFWLPVVTILFSVPLLVVSVAALFRFRWKSIAIFASVWTLLILDLVGFRAPAAWLSGQGFRVHTLLVQNYLSSCDLIHVVENGTKQTAGSCEAHDRGNYFDVIVYDTTGEFLVPAAKRTPEWKQVMSPIVSKLVDSDHCAVRLFGDLYHVYMNLEDLRG